MREIPLTMKYIALVDDEDYERLARFRWHARETRRQVYAVRWLPRNGGKRTAVYMHREILGFPDCEVDHHRHAEGLVVDNRRQNLRLAPGKTNQQNQRKQVGRHSIFKGVTWSHRDRRWCSGIKVSRKRFNLGQYRDEGHAALAYDAAAVKHFGDFAFTNFPVPGSTNWLYGPEVMHG